jgi:two-component system, NtrC family, response regulator AtoC
MKTVLIVDDNELVRKSLAASLISNEVTVETASNGKEGLEMAEKLHPDLLITDVHMPEMDGLKMIDKIREHEWGAKIPVIVMTVDEGTESINKALEAGITVYLSKNSTDPAGVVDQIKTALG